MWKRPSKSSWNYVSDELHSVYLKVEKFPKFCNLSVVSISGLKVFYWQNSDEIWPEQGMINPQCILPSLCPFGQTYWCNLTLTPKIGTTSTHELFMQWQLQCLKQKSFVTWSCCFGWWDRTPASTPKTFGMNSRIPEYLFFFENIINIRIPGYAIQDRVDGG